MFVLWDLELAKLGVESIKIISVEDEQHDKDYGINLKRFTRHEKVFPWRFIAKVIIGLTLMGLAYYMTKEMVSKENRETQEREKEQLSD